jgi:recombinational DNA repair protein RecT
MIPEVDVASLEAVMQELDSSGSNGYKYFILFSGNCQLHHVLHGAVERGKYYV